MSGTQRNLLVVVGITGAVMLVAGEHLYRQVIERRYQQAVESRRQLELRVGEMIATHEQVKRNFQQERQRSQELGQEVLSLRGRLEDAVGRLALEVTSVRELQGRMGVMQQQMDQLQGELALSLQARTKAVASAQPSPVQLERVVVSDGAASALRGRIVSIHKDWHFIVIDLGWDTVRIGDTVSIYHNEQLLAKARVDRVQEGVCAATLLPGWESAEVHVNDLVRIL